MELQCDKEAGETIAQAIRLAPREAKYHLLKATLLRYAEKTEEAVAELKQAAALTPGDPQYACELGQGLVTLSRDDEAAAAFRQALKADPQRVEALTGLAFVLGEQQKYEEARKHWARALENETKNVFGHLVAAQLSHEQGLDAQAREHFLAVLSIKPNHETALAGMVQLCQSKGADAERDRYRKLLYACHLQAVARDKNTARPCFCREQFKVGEHVILAYEYYELSGEMALVYRFDVSDSKGKQLLYRVSLGSYDSTTRMARELHAIKPNERMYHLDWYQNTATRRLHRTYGMFTTKPTYEKTRELVGAVVMEKIKPESSSDVPIGVGKK